MSKVEDKVCRLLQERAEFGLSKYGVSMERDDLSVKDWLKHTRDELMDAVVYLTRLIGDYDDI